jgi:hypothetical protein
MRQHQRRQTRAQRAESIADGRTGRSNSLAAAVVASNATNGAGTFRLSFGHRSSMARVAAHTPTAAKFTELAFCQYAARRSIACGGYLAAESPNAESSCCTRIVTPIAE